MKAKKVVTISLGILGALILLLVCTILFWLGPTVKMIAQRIGPKALGTPVTIEKLSINPRKGVLHLSGFAIANHESYARSNSVSLASLDIEVDMASIFSETVTVHQVQINSPHFIFEMSSASDNIAEYIQSVENFIGYDPTIPPTPEELKKKEDKKKKLAEKKKKKGDKPPKAVVVQSLEINDIQFHLAHTDSPRLDIGIGIEQLSVSMTNGAVQLKNLYVNNPGQLQSKNLFTLDAILVQMEPDSIYNPPLKVLDVQIHNPHCFVEWAYDASTVSEFLQIAQSTKERVMEWPLPKKDPNSTNEAVVAAVDTAPSPKIHTVSMTDFQFHLVNSIHNNRTIEIKLDSLNTDLMKGSVDVGAFTISNPRRLTLPNLFTLDGIRIELNPETLYSNKVSITDIQVRKPYLFLESNPDTDTVTELMKVADTITSRLPSNLVATASITTNDLAASEQIEEETEEGVEDIIVEPPVELHNLLVDDIQIKFLDSVPSNAPTNPRMLAGIGSISVKLVDGKIQISEISIPNMAGFQETNLFHLANIDIGIDPDSIFSDRMNIEQIFINAPEINLEQTETRGNISALQKSLTPLFPPTPEPSASAAQNTPAPVATNPPPTIAINPSAANTPINETDAAAVISNALPATVTVVEDGITNTTVTANTTNGPSPFAGSPVILSELIVTNFALNLTLPPDSSLIATNKNGKKLELRALNPSTYLGDKTPTNKPGISEISLVSFSDLNLRPLDGLLGINNLLIGNPPGFSNKHLVKINRFQIELDTTTLQSDTLLINEILIQKPRVSYELQIRTDNIKALEATIQGAVARRKDELGPGKPKPETVSAEKKKTVAATPEMPAKGEKQKVIIAHLLVKDGLVKAKISALPTATIPLPNIEKFNMGEKEGGTSLADASAALFDTFYDAIIGSVSSATGLATDTLKGAGSLTVDAMGNLFDGMGNMLRGTVDSSGNIITGTKEAVTETAEKIKKKRKSRGAGRRRSPLR